MPHSLGISSQEIIYVPGGVPKSLARIGESDVHIYSLTIRSNFLNRSFGLQLAHILAIGHFVLIFRARHLDVCPR